MMFDVKRTRPDAPLYRPEFEHDNCGIGACVNIKGVKSRETVENQTAAGHRDQSTHHNYKHRAPRRRNRLHRQSDCPQPNT